MALSQSQTEEKIAVWLEALEKEFPEHFKGDFPDDVIRAMAMMHGRLAQSIRRGDYKYGR